MEINQPNWSEGRLPGVLDLSKLQIKLAETGQLPRLEAVIRRSLLCQSCLGDLREAIDTFAALQKLLRTIRGEGSVERAATETALQNTAVLLYVRATVTKASRRHGEERERGPSNIRDVLSGQQLADHEALVTVRSEAIAHVYMNREVDGQQWHSGASLLIDTPRGWLPAAASRRLKLDRITVQRLGRALPIADAILTDRSQERLADVAFVLKDEPPGSLDAMLSDCWIDHLKFFGSEEAARAALTDIKLGRWVMFEGP